MWYEIWKIVQFKISLVLFHHQAGTKFRAVIMVAILNYSVKFNIATKITALNGVL